MMRRGPRQHSAQQEYAALVFDLQLTLPKLVVGGSTTLSIYCAQAGEVFVNHRLACTAFSYSCHHSYDDASDEDDD